MSDPVSTAAPRLTMVQVRGVQSPDDALVMADAILAPEHDGTEWLRTHGCDVMDHLRAEVRRLRALAPQPSPAGALDVAATTTTERIDAALAAIRDKRTDVPALLAWIAGEPARTAAAVAAERAACLRCTEFGEEGFDDLTVEDVAEMIAAAIRARGAAPAQGVG